MDRHRLFRQPGARVGTAAARAWSNMGSFDSNTGQCLPFLNHAWNDVQSWASSSSSFASTTSSALQLSATSLNLTASHAAHAGHGRRPVDSSPSTPDSGKPLAARSPPPAHAIHWGLPRLTPGLNALDPDSERLPPGGQLALPAVLVPRALDTQADHLQASTGIVTDAKCPTLHSSTRRAECDADGAIGSRHQGCEGDGTPYWSGQSRPHWLP
jgi:hypothetical protein